jgi:hypothetical protein
MVRIIGIPGTPPPPAQIGFTVNAPPPPGTPGGTDCSCADLGAVWFNGGLFATVIADDAAPATFALTGTICPDTTYTVAPLWSPDADGAQPLVELFAASAWRVTPSDNTDTGVLTLTVTAVCAGQTFALPSIFLTILPGDYGSSPPTDCLPPTDDYVNIFDLVACGVTFVYHGDVDTIFEEVDDWFIVGLPFYQGPLGTVTTQTCITFNGLNTLFGSHDMSVRITVRDVSADQSAPYPICIDTHDSVADGHFTLGQTWTRTVASADIATFLTGAGSENGAGTTGEYVQFTVEVKAI